MRRPSLRSLVLNALGALALAVTLAPYAHAQDVPARIKQAGKLVIGTNPNYPPITYKDTATNLRTGFDIDLGEAVAKELGVAAEWQEIAFAQMLPSIQTGRIDTVMAGMSDKPARREIVEFVDYLSTGAQMYTLEANATTIKAPADLCGKKVGASRSTTWPADIEKWSAENCVAQGKPAIMVVGTEGSVDARTQLKSGRLDGAVQGNETLAFLQSVEPKTFVLLGTPFKSDTIGMPVIKTDVELRDAIKGALDRLQSKGIYSKIAEKYGLQANELKAITLNKGTD